MSRSQQPQTLHAYVSIRGSRSNRQVNRDASPASSTSPSPFAALVLGHPDGTSTRFELSYRADATLRDGSEGALVDLALVSPLAESLTLCRVLVPADGKSEPVPSYSKPEEPTALQRAAVEAYNFLCNADLSDFIREHDKEIRLRLAAALDAEGINVDDLTDAPSLSTASPAESFTGSPEPTGTASAAEAFEGRRS